MGRYSPLRLPLNKSIPDYETRIHGVTHNRCRCRFAERASVQSLERLKRVSGFSRTGLLMRVFLATLVLLFASAARGEVSASLPLHGYFRSGRFMPVRLQVRDMNASVVIEGDGAASTEYRAQGNSDVVVPWLPLLATVGSPHIKGGVGSDVALHALTDDERLVALGGEESESAQSLFPGKRVVAIPLDLSRPLLDPPLAWGGLDGVVLSSAAAKQLSPGQVEMLASAGVVLAVRGSPPDSRWPWKREGDFWILRHEPAGPRDVIEEAAYGPTYTWQRAWPASFRGQLLVGGLVFVLLAVAVSLWRSRVTIIAFVALCAVSLALVAGWYSRQSPVLGLAGGVMISDAPVSQIDAWHWRSPLRPADDAFPADGLTYPILPDAKHAATVQLRLVCRPDGSPSTFEYHLGSQQSLAFVTRLLRPDTPRPSLAPAQEPFESFAEALYVSPGQSIRGQFLAIDPHSGRPVPVIVIDGGNQR